MVQPKKRKTEGQTKKKKKTVVPIRILTTNIKAGNVNNTHKTFNRVVDTLEIMFGECELFSQL